MLVFSLLNKRQWFSAALNDPVVSLAPVSALVFSLSSYLPQDELAVARSQDHQARVGKYTPGRRTKDLVASNIVDDQQRS